jgi:hypothetical protein
MLVSCSKDPPKLLLLRSSIAPPSRPFVSEIKARAHQYMEPIRATAPADEWRTNPVQIDLTDSVGTIKPPVDYPTFATPGRPSFTSVNQGTRQQPYDLTDGTTTWNTKPPTYSLPPGGGVPGMTHYAGDYLDTAKTTESIKELLEGINDEPVMPKRTKRKKVKLLKKEEDELAAMMEGADLTEKKYDPTVDPDEEVKEDPVEEEAGEEEEEEEDMSKVEGLNVSLLPHQVRGLAFLLSREENKARGGILADDVRMSLHLFGRQYVDSL